MPAKTGFSEELYLGAEKGYEYFSPHFCLKYPSRKRFNYPSRKHFFVRRTIFSADLEPVEARISVKRSSTGSGISVLSGDTNILTPQFCLKYPSSKTQFLFCDQGNILGDPGRFGHKSFKPSANSNGLYLTNFDSINDIK